MGSRHSTEDSVTMNILSFFLPFSCFYSRCIQRMDIDTSKATFKAINSRENLTASPKVHIHLLGHIRLAWAANPRSCFHLVEHNISTFLEAIPRTECESGFRSWSLWACEYLMEGCTDLKPANGRKKGVVPSVRTFSCQ